MSDDWTRGNPVTFTCLRCACVLGRFPETTRGLEPLCSACAAQPPTVHRGWFRRADGHVERRAAG